MYNLQIISLSQDSSSQFPQWQSESFPGATFGALDNNYIKTWYYSYHKWCYWIWSKEKNSRALPYFENIHHSAGTVNSADFPLIESYRSCCSLQYHTLFTTLTYSLLTDWKRTQTLSMDIFSLDFLFLIIVIHKFFLESFWHSFLALIFYPHG